MTTSPLQVDAVAIRDAMGLDPIHIFWHDVEPGKGYVTMICYGSAWTAYFGAMSGRGIKEFFAHADTEYLVSKLGITPHLKATKRDHKYLARIIDAVKQSLQVAIDGKPEEGR